MTDVLKKFDDWLHDDGPAALVIREHLMPVEGYDGVLFPPTFAAAEDKNKFAGGFNIDKFSDGTNVCVIDSVGSQANRIEPIFEKPQYAHLVPQIVVVAGKHRVSLLTAGHRAADAIVRCSSLSAELRSAFESVQRGDSEPLAKVAPTSLVFGAWDSRDTQAKLPRLLASSIRAYNVLPLTRSAQFTPAIDYVKNELLPEPEGKATKDLYAQRGFVHVPATGTPGGVIARGGIRRDAALHLAALRLLRADSEQNTLKLRRYVLGLALVAFAEPAAGYLRQGCNLVLDPDKPRAVSIVAQDGTRTEVTFKQSDVLQYATECAKAFTVGQNRDVPFDHALAKKDTAGDENPKAAKSKKKSG